MIGRFRGHGRGKLKRQAPDGLDWSNYMAKIDKCDNCGELHSAQNPVLRRTDALRLNSQRLSIFVDIPQTWQYRDICEKCAAEIISSQFVELCALLAPYRPARVSGFVQAGSESTKESLTKAEHDALAVLSRRLLGT